jgi:hypothetical protein
MFGAICTLDSERLLRWELLREIDSFDSVCRRFSGGALSLDFGDM